MSVAVVVYFLYSLALFILEKFENDIFVLVTEVEPYRQYQKFLGQWPKSS